MKNPPKTMKGIINAGTRAVATSIFVITIESNYPYETPYQYVRT
jgi:hypothetical protein